MAALNPIRNAKKTPMHIDMAPMVDLALLLVIFFMVTLALNKPKTLLLTMPAARTCVGEIMEYCGGTTTTTLILEENNRIFCYRGIEEPTVFVTNYSPGGLRKILTSQIADANHMSRDAIFLIKPTSQASYQNLVDVLDEMKITGAKIYAIRPIYPYDQEVVKNYREQQSIGG